MERPLPALEPGGEVHHGQPKRPLFRRQCRGDPGMELTRLSFDRGIVLDPGGRPGGGARRGEVRRQEMEVVSMCTSRFGGGRSSGCTGMPSDPGRRPRARLRANQPGEHPEREGWVGDQVADVVELPFPQPGNQADDALGLLVVDHDVVNKAGARGEGARFFASHSTPIHASGSAHEPRGTRGGTGSCPRSLHTGKIVFARRAAPGCAGAAPERPAGLRLPRA